MPKNIVGVVVNRTVRDVDRVFHYHAPDEIYEKLQIGCMVSVPFGKGDKPIEAFVVAFPNETEFDELKEIQMIIEQEPLFSEDILKVCYFMRDQYFCTLISTLKIVTPPGSGLSAAKINDKVIKGATLTVLYDEAFDILETIRYKAPLQAKIIELMLQNDFVSYADIRFLTGCSHSAIKTLEKKGILEPMEVEVFRNPVDYNKIQRTQPHTPTKEQQVAIDHITQAVDAKKQETFLLFGVTGSGKTEVFLRCIDHVIEKGKSAIVLVPEISLTPQMVERFVGRFGKRVAILHSRLSLGERNDEHKRIKSGEVDVVIGVRSAVFAPLDNVGIIVMDEEHENTYKSEKSPTYHTREVALYRAKLGNYPVVLASATPSIESYYKANCGEYKLITLQKRANNKDMPQVSIVDMRKELIEGNRSVLSEELKQEIRNNIDNKQQTILFLNRRGFSTFVSCRNCGYVAKCKYCNISLTYHKNKSYLTCHYCGYTIRNLKQCPTCDSIYIKHFGTGTQRVEEEIRVLFPDASMLRMDVDTTTKKSSHQDILDTFRKERTDILIGTQMVAKGLDFPNVTLVGVLAADMSLNLDDFRANERTFGLITQVCGRAGRGEIPGRAIIQTYMPQSNVLHLAKEQDYVSFYEEEIQLRNGLNYPPFCDIISILCTSVNEASLVTYIKKVAELLKKDFQKIQADKVEVLGPSASVLSRINNKYRWRITIKCKLNEQVKQLLNDVLNHHNKSKEKKWIHMLIESNPNSIL